MIMLMHHATHISMPCTLLMPCTLPMQAFLRKLFTVDLPGLMVLPRRLEINIPPAVTAVAEAAVGRDAVMRAVASAVLQADALEHALHAALPLGPQSPAGGIMLPDSFSVRVVVYLVCGGVLSGCGRLHQPSLLSFCCCPAMCMHAPCMVHSHGTAAPSPPHARTLALDRASCK